MMPRDDIEKLKDRNCELVDMLCDCECKLAARDIDYESLHNTNEETKRDCTILARKLLEVKPELEEWVELNFGEYL